MAPQEFIDSYFVTKRWENVPPRFRLVFSIFECLFGVIALVAACVGVVFMLMLMLMLMLLVFSGQQNADSSPPYKRFFVGMGVCAVVCTSYVLGRSRLRELLVARFGTKQLEAEEPSLPVEKQGHFIGYSIVAFSLTIFLSYAGVQGDSSAILWALLTFTIGCFLIASCVFAHRAASLLTWSVPAALFPMFFGMVAIATAHAIHDMERKAFFPIALLVGENALWGVYLVGWPSFVWLYFFRSSSKRYGIGCIVTITHLVLMVALASVAWPESVRGISQIIHYYGAAPVMIGLWFWIPQRLQTRIHVDKRDRRTGRFRFLPFLPIRRQKMQETRYVDKDFSPQKLAEFLRDIYWEASLSEPDEDGEPAAFQVHATTPSGAYADLRVDDNQMAFRHFVQISKDTDPSKLLHIQSELRWSACITYILNEEYAAAMITYRLPIPTGTPFAVIVDALRWFGAEVLRWYQVTKEIRE